MKLRELHDKLEDIKPLLSGEERKRWDEIEATIKLFEKQERNKSGRA